MDSPAFARGMREQQPHGLQALHGSEDFIEIDPLALNIALCDQPGLVLGDDPGCVLLGLIDPLEADRPRVRRRLDQLLGAIRLDGCHLIQHRVVPALVV